MKISIAKKILKSEEKFNTTPRSLAAWMNLAFPDMTATGPTWRRRLDEARVQIDDFNNQLLEEVNQGGKVYLTHTSLKDSYILRMCVGQTNTEEQQVWRAWDLLKQTAEQMSQS